MKVIIKKLASLIYHVPFDHDLYEIYWYFKYKLKNLIKYRGFDFFYKVELETITVCNRRCKYCPNFLFPKEERLMDFNLFLKVIDDLVKINYSGIIAPHFYGEPLLDKRILEFSKYIKKKLPKAYILIYTNGDYLDKNLFTELVKSGVNKFFVTEHENKSPEKFMDWYKNAPFSNKRKIIFQKMDENSVLSNRGGLVRVKTKKKFKRCFMPQNNLVIDVDGNVLLCCNDFWGGYKFGNVKERSIIKIWKDEKYKKYRDEINRGKFSLQICKKCRS